MDTDDQSAQYLICRDLTSNSYISYRCDFGAEELFVPLDESSGGTLEAGSRVAQVGGYLLIWSSRISLNGVDGYSYRLLDSGLESQDPLNAAPLQSGFWKQEKFWGYRDYYSENPDEGQQLDLIPMGSFVLNMIPARGRGTYELWNFDPAPLSPGQTDPLPAPYTGQNGFQLIRKGHQLLPIGNYVLERLPERTRYRLWSFDPQQISPLSLPTVQEGVWPDIGAEQELTVLGDKVLERCLQSGRYRLWGFDPEAQNVLVGPLREGVLPEGISAASELVGFLGKRSVDSAQAVQPGSIDFMRSKIRHVVYYMLESRSFDNVCGWLYEKGEEGCNYIGPGGAFDGASYDNFNLNGSDKVHVSQFKDGELSDQWDLVALDQDPFHDTTDNLQQMFAESPGYWGRQTPDMGGFVLSNANPQVMESFSPTQLPVLNGLAREFAISDRWFSSIPGGTDVNRAFSVTGSAFDRLGTWEGGDAYKYWPNSPHRQSLWKLLWSQGITDWKIYYQVEWKDEVFTNQLYLKGQIPSVDSNDQLFIADLDQFKQDAANGTLPAFSYLEPAWIAPKGATSYHPGGDLVPGEQMLNEIYEAIKQGPGWEQTLLVVTFDKNGGLYDHVAPPYAAKPWPNDLNNGFAYDLMGPRVPAILVSPWIKLQTVFRAYGATPYDSTSFAATLLKWFGVPRPLWSLGDRMAKAPTFEKVFQCPSVRSDRPVFTPPYDKSYPQEGD
ncbi:alkaline phosphatase family protein [Marinobacterium lutimaris]|uniref:Phospholipase C n=1 Tax=Marinobacterium lutimaris TaxID=568106 RepID=A0A1H6APK1_9GAMM|nr:alkaline phosphatase family protein [Marinobacterium lutimaris]SEG49997.1 Phospholipase C [Marinobacterium lutimaris]